MYVCICANHTQITKRLDSESGEVGIDRFRGNIIVRGGAPYDEDSWKRVMIQGQHLNVLGPCTRCQMICVNPSTGERTNEPLRTLATFRRESVCMHRAVCISYQSINSRAGCCSGSIWRMMCMLRLVRLSFPSVRKWPLQNEHLFRRHQHVSDSRRRRSAQASGDAIIPRGGGSQADPIG